MKPLGGTVTSWAAEFGAQFRNRRVLVTGATGFIGRHLCRALLALGAEVTGLSRSAETSTVPKGVRPLAVDLCGLGEVEAAMDHVRPNLIFHLGAHVTARPDRELVLPMFEANAAGTIHLLMAALARGCERFVLIGSAEALDATNELGPNSPYSASKLVAEIYGQMFYRLYGLPVVCVRPFLTYGPEQEATKLIPYTILTLLQRANPLLTTGNRVCDAIYVEDVVRGLLMAAVAPASILGERIDLGSGKGMTIRELVETIVTLLDSPGAPIFGAIPDRPNEPTIEADLERTRSLLGWTPHWSLEGGLRETVTWYRQYARSGGQQ